MTEDKKEITVPAKFKDIVKSIEEMTVLDLSELVKVLEEKFGVSAAAPVAMAVAASGGAAPEAEAKTSFNVELTSIGDQKIAVIKAIKEVTGLGLKEAKDLVDKAPAIVKENLPKADAEELKSKIEAAGAQVTLK